MTTTSNPTASFHAIRCSYAAAVFQLLRLDRPDDALTYDGEVTISAGPVTVRFAPKAVEVEFSDPYSDSHATVTLAIAEDYTLGGIVTVVEALLHRLAVTP